nr:15720_t:CDS:2 [Entrophospora candida]
MKVFEIEKTCQGPFAIYTFISAATFFTSFSKSGSTITSPTTICPIHLAVDGEDTSQNIIDNKHLNEDDYLFICCKNNNEIIEHNNDHIIYSLKVGGTFEIDNKLKHFYTIML